jgi:hypothetical protein
MIVAVFFLPVVDEKNCCLAVKFCVKAKNSNNYYHDENKFVRGGLNAISSVESQSQLPAQC